MSSIVYFNIKIYGNLLEFGMGEEGKEWFFFIGTKDCRKFWYMTDLWQNISPGIYNKCQMTKFCFVSGFKIVKYHPKISKVNKLDVI